MVGDVGLRAVCTLFITVRTATCGGGVDCNEALKAGRCFLSVCLSIRPSVRLLCLPETYSRNSM